MFNHSAVSECILLLLMLIKIAAKITLKLNIVVTKITITELFDVECQDHLLDGLGPTGVTLLEVVSLPTDVFLTGVVDVSRTFFALAVVGFM